MGLVVTPIVKRKEEDWKSWCLKMKGEMKSEFDDLSKRHNLTQHDIWAVESPNGLMAVVCTRNRVPIRLCKMLPFLKIALISH